MIALHFSERFAVPGQLVAMAVTASMAVKKIKPKGLDDLLVHYGRFPDIL